MMSVSLLGFRRQSLQATFAALKLHRRLFSPSRHLAGISRSDGCRVGRDSRKSNGYAEKLEELRLYRGVAKSHPAWQLALKGVAAAPGKKVIPHEVTAQETLQALDRAILHNKGVPAGSLSQFTSWTTNKDVAAIFAGPGGVVLEAVIQPGVQRVHWSPDEWNEQEVLVEGDVTGCTVAVVDGKDRGIMRLPWLTDPRWPPGLETFVLDHLAIREVLLLRRVDRATCALIEYHKPLRRSPTVAWIVADGEELIQFYKRKRGALLKLGKPDHLIQALIFLPDNVGHLNRNMHELRNECANLFLRGTRHEEFRDVGLPQALGNCMAAMPLLVSLNLDQVVFANERPQNQAYDMVLAPLAAEGCAARLLHLDISHSELTEFPMQIANLTRLQTLEFHVSHFRNLPDALGKLTNMTRLALVYCGWLECLPPEIGLLLRLVELDLSRCENIAYLPTAITSLSELRTLSLNQCYSLQMVPEPIWQLPLLETLDVSSCNLLAIPEQVSRLHCLRTLHASHNREVTCLPDSIGNLSNLHVLDLRGCGLESLTPAIGRLTRLTRLDISMCNKLRGLPDALGCLTGLSVLSLERSHGIAQNMYLPHCIYHLSQLRQLNLRGCNAWVEGRPLSNLSRLTRLNMSSNGVGLLPDALTTLRRLRVLDVSNNPLSGDANSYIAHILMARGVVVHGVR